MQNQKFKWLKQQKINNFKIKKMKVTTANPVIIDDIKVDPIDMYLSAEGNADEETYTEGDLKVTTMNPVIINDTNVSPNDYYSNYGGALGQSTQQISQLQTKLNQSPSLEEQLKAKKKGQFWNKAKGAWEKISNSPLANFALQQLAAYQAQKLGGGMDMSSQGNFTQQQQQEQVEEKKMTTTTKILLGVGGALVLGLIIYAVMSGDSKGKSTK